MRPYKQQSISFISLPSCLGFCDDICIERVFSDLEHRLFDRMLPADLTGFYSVISLIKTSASAMEASISATSDATSASIVTSSS